MSALETLGYRHAGYHYEHLRNPFLLEFPPGPLSIGDELVTRWDTLREGDLLLHVLSPTDSCRDRLAAFYHFGDRSALEAAVAIHAAHADRVSLSRIRRWSRDGGAENRFQEFERALRSQGGSESAGSSSCRKPARLGSMPSLPHPAQFLLVTLAGFMNHRQGLILDYLLEENRVLN